MHREAGARIELVAFGGVDTGGKPMSRLSPAAAPPASTPGGATATPANPFLADLDASGAPDNPFARTAPAGLESTGEPTFCTLWTMLGLPAVSLPLLQGANGLPLGVQLVGPRHGDGRLLRTARWLAESVGA